MAEIPGGRFDADAVEPSTTMEALPAGKYLVAITESSTGRTKAGTGEMVKLVYTVLDGPFKGRKVFDNLCMSHPNAKTVEIARANLSAICRAINVRSPRDTVELHNLPLMITVKVTNGENGPQNDVKGYEPRNASPVNPQQQQPAGLNIPPYRR